MRKWTTFGKIERDAKAVLESEIYLTERKEFYGKTYWSGTFNIPPGCIVEPGNYRLTLKDTQSCDITVGPSSPNSINVPREAGFKGEPDGQSKT